MAFHPAYWSKPVANTSRDYNYYLWNERHRGAHVAKYVAQDPRPLPRATEPMAMDPQIRVICPVGGTLLFSGAQMHSSVENTSGITRFSVDFRTVNLDDAANHRGAPNVDSACTGTTMRDYLRVTDLTRLPDDVVALHDDGTAAAGKAVYSGE